MKFNFLINWGMLILSAVFGTLTTYLAKKTFNKFGGIVLSDFAGAVKYALILFKEPLMYLAGFSFVISIGLWLTVLTRMDLSLSYPILVAMQLVLIPLIGYFFLNEVVGGYRLIGIFLIIASLFFFYKS